MEEVKEELTPEIIEARKSMDAVYDAGVGIYIKATQDFMDYINANQNEIRAAIKKNAEAHQDEGMLKLIEKDDNIALISLAYNMAEEVYGRVKTLAILLKISGKMNKPWNDLYAEFAKAGEEIKKRVEEAATAA